MAVGIAVVAGGPQANSDISVNSSRKTGIDFSFIERVIMEEVYTLEGDHSGGT